MLLLFDSRLIGLFILVKMHIIIDGVLIHKSSLEFLFLVCRDLFSRQILESLVQNLDNDFNLVPALIGVHLVVVALF